MNENGGEMKSRDVKSKWPVGRQVVVVVVVVVSGCDGIDGEKRPKPPTM